MPIHECAIRIVFPCPDMQRIKRRKAEPVGSFEVVKELPHQLRRSAGVRLVPRISQHEEIRSGQPRLPARVRLIDHDLRVGSPLAMAELFTSPLRLIPILP
jgi:hypothetical protein